MKLEDYFQEGESFPPSSEKIRIENENNYRLLFRNDFVSLFKNDIIKRLKLDGYPYLNYETGNFMFMKKIEDENKKINTRLINSNVSIDNLISSMPLASASTKIFEKFTVGVFPEVKIPTADEKTKKWIKEFKEKEIDKYIKMWSNERDYKGNSVVKLAIKEDSDVKSVTCNASNWFVVANEFDDQDIIAHIVWRKKTIINDEGKETVLLVEIHTIGQIEYRAYSYGGRGIKYQVDISNYIEMKENENLKKDNLSYIYKTWNPNGFTIFQIRNSMDIESSYGVSDYEPVFASIRQLTISITLMAHIFDKTGDPPLQVPNEFFEEVPTGECYEDGSPRVKLEFMGRDSAIPSDKESKDLKYAEYKGNLVENMSFVDKDLLTSIFIGLSINKSVLGIIESAKVNASGEAYKKQQQTTLDTARNKIQYIQPVIKEMIKVAYLAKFNKPLEEEIEIIFKEGISLSDNEKITNAMLGNGNKPVLTLEESIVYTGKTQEQAKISATIIKEEEGLIDGKTILDEVTGSAEVFSKEQPKTEVVNNKAI